MRRKILKGMFISTLLYIAAVAIAFTVFFYYGWTLVPVGFFLVFITLVNYYIASRLSRKITDSISQIDFNTPEDIDTYDELASFVRTILRQQNQIESQMDELSEHQETISSIFENMQEGFIMLDRFGAIVTANHSARALFDADEDYEGKNINYLARNPAILDKVKSALMGHSSQMILEADNIYQISFIPSPDRGIIILIANITEEKLAEKIRREFTANVSHELNSPLTCIAGFAELLSKGNLEEDDVIHFGNKINDEARRMILLVENILFLSQLDEMNGKENWTQFEIAHVAADAIKSLQPEADDRKIELILADAPCTIYGNRQLLYVMFTNLISNAIRYNKPKGWVKIVISSRNRSAYINVTDTGIGIPKEEQFRVFERFYRVEHSRNQNTGGAGLGLSIVKHIVRHHDGTIDLESEPGEGTRVYIRMPITNILVLNNI